MLRALAPLTIRFLPLYVAAFFQGFSLFFPIEKLFMTEIGFDAASIGLMAAFYSVFVPLIEAPSGILADRWSRKGVLIIASFGLMMMALIGGLSQDVPTYLTATLFLSLFLAMFSGTYDSVVYDTVLEETGKSDEFEKHIGRVRFLFSAAVVITALAGGVLASMFDLRFTYFASIPLIALSIIALLRFKEPKLHKSQEVITVKSQIVATYKLLLRRSTLLPLVTILAAAGLLANIVIEFSQLWLIGLAAAVALYGPAAALLQTADGFGGLLASKARLDKRVILGVTVVLLIGASLVLALVKDLAAVIAAQVVIAGLVAVISIICTKLLHDQVPSQVRAGVASGVGAFTWMTFVPFSVLFGVLAEKDVFEAAWLIVPFALLTSVLLIRLSIGRRFAGTHDLPMQADRLPDAKVKK